MGEQVNFEAGQVVKWRDASVARYAIRSVEPDYVRCWRLDNDDRFCGFQISAYGASFELVSPAPRAGDTWTSGESVARIEADGAQLRIVSVGEPFVGDVVAVARKLWERGYRMVDATHGKPVVRRAEQRAPAYATLDDMKECVPASLAALDGTWPAFTPSAEVDGGIHPTREGVERMFARLNAAEQKYMEAEQAMSAKAFASVLRQADEEMSQAILGPSYLAPHADKALAVTLPPLPVGTYTLSMDPEAGTVELRGAHSGRLPASTDDLPRAGDVYQSAWETVELMRCAGGTLRTRTLSSTLTDVACVESRGTAENMARHLSERGFARLEHETGRRIVAMFGGERRVDGKWHVYESREDRRRMEQEKAEAIAKAAIVSGAPVSAVADAAQRVSIAAQRVRGVRRAVRQTRPRVARWHDAAAAAARRRALRTRHVAQARRRSRRAPAWRALRGRHPSRARWRLRAREPDAGGNRSDDRRAAALGSAAAVRPRSGRARASYRRLRARRSVEPAAGRGDRRAASCPRLRARVGLRHPLVPLRTRTRVTLSVPCGRTLHVRAPGDVAASHAAVQPRDLSLGKRIPVSRLTTSWCHQISSIGRASKRPRTHAAASGVCTSAVGEVTMGEHSGGSGGAGLGWELEADGAGNVADRAWVYPSGATAVKLTWVDSEGRSRMCVVPNAVLAHVLRAQGYAVDDGMEAAR